MATRRREPPEYYDPRSGDLPVRVEHVSMNAAHEPARTNYFAIYAIESGSGQFWAGTARHPFDPRSLVFFVPYQHIRFEPVRPAAATLIRFHANFLCVETFHAETGCSGALFNDPYSVPAVTFDKKGWNEIAGLIHQIDREQEARDLAWNDAIVSYLKVLLIVATRRKAALPGSCPPGFAGARHPVVARLGELIEENFHTLHAPADYAALLHVTPKALGKVVREHLGKSLTDLIRDRILSHAKWELLHTLRPVKEIAREIGFADELYFSRLFKKSTGMSPTHFRAFETEIRGGSNLSIPLARAPIHRAAGQADNSNIAPGTPRFGESGE